MENIWFGLQNIFLNMGQVISVLIAQPALWGFVAGFGVSTIIHLLVVADNPQAAAQMVTQELTSSYMKLAHRKSDGTFGTSFSQFEKEYNRVRLIFFSAMLALLVTVVLELEKGQL